MASQWFCKVLGQQIGPVGFREMVEMVRAGTLKENDAVRRDGTSQWTRAREVTGLFRAAEKESAQARAEVKPESVPLKTSGKTKETTAPPSEPRRIGRRRALLAGGLVFALLLLVVGVTAWRANRRERFPEPIRRGPRVVHDDLLAPLAAKRSATPSTPVPNDPVPRPASGDARGLKARLILDFREDFETQAIVLLSERSPGADAAIPPATVEHFTFDPAGMRVTMPHGSPLQFCCGYPRVRVRGDFQVTAQYTILEMEPPTGRHGTGVGISVQDTDGERASVRRVFRVREGHVFSAVRAERREDGEYRYRRHYQDTSSDVLSGWMRLERVGSSIRYQIAAPHSERFVQIHEDAFPTNDMVRAVFKTQTDGSSAAVDVVWSYFDVQAEEIVKEY